jgi:hypothetical protein
MKKKEKIGKLKKKNFKKNLKKKISKKIKKGGNTVDYCCNPQCFVCGGTVIPPHGLEYVVIGE